MRIILESVRIIGLRIRPLVVSRENIEHNVFKLLQTFSILSFELRVAI